MIPRREARDAPGAGMLYDDEEKAIMSAALQPNMRKPTISPKPFEAIIADQLADIDFTGQSVLDIGPGQFDFLDIVKRAGAARTMGIDFDPAIARLGARRGHEVAVADFRDGWPLEQAFDGIFCRGSINLFWFPQDDALAAFLGGLASSLRPGGWLWIAPWNKPGEATSREVIDRVEAAAARWRAQTGIASIEPDMETAKRFGIGYGVPRIEIWKRLPDGPA